MDCQHPQRFRSAGQLVALARDALAESVTEMTHNAAPATAITDQPVNVQHAATFTRATNGPIEIRYEPPIRTEAGDVVGHAADLSRVGHYRNGRLVATYTRDGDVYRLAASPAGTTAEGDPFEGLLNGCGAGARYLADHLAQAWLVISRAEEGDGRSNRSFPDEIPVYVDEDWSKMVARRLNGYARLHDRPTHFPWGAAEFDQFDWRASTTAEGDPPPPGGGLPILCP